MRMRNSPCCWAGGRILTASTEVWVTWKDVPFTDGDSMGTQLLASEFFISCYPSPSEGPDTKQTNSRYLANVDKLQNGLPSPIYLTLFRNY